MDVNNSLLVGQNITTFVEYLFCDNSLSDGKVLKSEVSVGSGEGQCPAGHPSSSGMGAGADPLLDTLLHKTGKRGAGRKILFRR